MHKFLASIYKEALLLIRDPGGLAILFLMPLLLVITITLVQDSTFRTLQDTRISIVVVDNDKGAVSETIQKGITTSNSFQIVSIGKESEARDLVLKGAYQLAIIIPENLSKQLNDKVTSKVDDILLDLGAIEQPSQNKRHSAFEPAEITLYFDPAVQQTFKSSVRNGIDRMISKIESQTIYSAFSEQLGESAQETMENENFLMFKEVVPAGETGSTLPTSTQHNVPAWALFAIFFIILPLSINMVKEKHQGTYIRLRTQPLGYGVYLMGKGTVYLVVALLQFILMLLIGMYLFPTLGLPGLEVNHRLPLLFLTAAFAGLAAVGLGLLLGTLAKTQEQSAPFGATLVVILAALGGVWVPVFAMPGFMQVLSKISPMNWGLNAFYDVFLRNIGFWEIAPEIGLLFLFFIVTTFIAIIYNEKKNAV